MAGYVGREDGEPAGTTGMHCYLSQNRCRKGPVCAITDGSAANPYACARLSEASKTAGTTGVHSYQ